jgi:hypothetical protein
MCAKKKTGQKGSGARVDVALVRIEQQRAGGTPRSDAEKHKTTETQLTIPPELEPVFQLLVNCLNEFSRHRESLPEESARWLMENLYPEMQTIDGFFSLIESEIDQRQTTSPMSTFEQAKTFVISFLRQLDFEKGFIAAIERYKEDLKNVPELKEFYANVKAGRSRTVAGAKKTQGNRRKATDAKVLEAYRTLRRTTPIPKQKDIARMVGRTDGYISKIMQKLEADGRLQSDDDPDRGSSVNHAKK